MEHEFSSSKLEQHLATPIWNIVLTSFRYPISDKHYYHHLEYPSKCIKITWPIFFQLLPHFQTNQLINPYPNILLLESCAKGTHGLTRYVRCNAVQARRRCENVHPKASIHVFSSSNGVPANLPTQC